MLQSPNEPRLRLGVLIPNASTDGHMDFAAYGRTAENAGAHFLWVSDHVVFPSESVSAYPVGEAPYWWHPDAHWIDCLTVCGALLGATTKVMVGSSVLLLPLRHPVHVAKAAMSLAYVSRGRFALGLGLGWQREELETFGVNFDARGALMDETLDLVTTALRGEVGPHQGRFYDLPHRVFLRPTADEVGGVPVLLGGISGAALRRIAKGADGWLAVARPAEFDLDRFTAQLRGITEQWQTAGRKGRPFVSVRLLIDDLQPHRALVDALSEFAVDEIAFVPKFGDPARTADTIHAAAAVLKELS